MVLLFQSFGLHCLLERNGSVISVLWLELFSRTNNSWSLKECSFCFVHMSNSVTNVFSWVAHNPESLCAIAHMPILVYVYKSAVLKVCRAVLRKSLEIVHALRGLLCSTVTGMPCLPWIPLSSSKSYYANIILPPFRNIRCFRFVK
jgi:hypothetical protein